MANSKRFTGALPHLTNGELGLAGRRYNFYVYDDICRELFNARHDMLMKEKDDIVIRNNKFLGKDFIGIIRGNHNILSTSMTRESISNRRKMGYTHKIDPELISTVEEIIKETDNIEREEGIVRTFLRNLNATAKSVQDLRDILPDELIQSAEALMSLDRTREPFYNYLDNKEWLEGYNTEIRPILDHCIASRLLF